MKNILVVSSTDKGKEFLLELLSADDAPNIITASSGNEARSLLIEETIDLVVINTPLSDEFGRDLALMVAATTQSGVILMVKSELADEVFCKVEDYGVFVLPKPISRQMFCQSLKLVAASRKRIVGLKNENIQLQHKISEVKIVDRAKCALIQYLKMTEPQAHRYIEKQAMDMRVTKKEIAEGILKIYEN